MRKILSLVLVLSLVLGSMSFAFAADTFKDVTDENQLDAVKRLNALGVVDGYEDGTYKPEGAITRAEFSKLLVVALGLENAAEAAKGSSQFTDVVGTEWYAGYVNVSVGQGIVKGYSDGSFMSNKTVSYAEAITMLVRALGYKDEFLPGSWPGNFVAKAAELDLTDGVNFATGGLATRGDVAVLVNNTLDAKVIKQNSYGDNNDFVEGGTLLAEKLDVVKYKNAVVKAIPRVSSTLNSDEISFAYGDDTYKKDFIADTNVEKLLGLKANVYVNEDGDVFFVELSDDYTIMYDVVADDGADTIKDFKFDLIVADDTYEFATGEVSSSTVNKAAMYINNSSKSESAFETVAQAGGLFGKFVLDETNKVVLVDAYDWTSKYDAAIVTEVVESRNVIKYMKSSESVKEIDLDDDADAYVIQDTKGNAMTLDEIEEDDVIYVAEGTNKATKDDTFYIFVVRDTVTGELEEYESTSNVVIGDDSYSIGTVNTISLDDNETLVAVNTSDLDDALDADVKALLDIIGDVRHLTTAVESTSDSMFGLVVGLDNTDWGTEKVKIFTKDKEKVVYEFDLPSAATTTYGSLALENFVKYTLDKDGEINDLNIIVANAKTTAGYINISPSIDFGSSSVNLPTVDEQFMNDSTVIFNFESYASTGKTGDIEVLVWDDLAKKENVSGYALIDTTSKNAEYLVFVDGLGSATTDTYYGYLLDVKTTSDGDKAKVRVSGEDDAQYFYTDLPSTTTLTQKDVIKFQLNSANEMVTASHTADTVTGVVYDIDGDYIKIATTYTDTDADGVIETGESVTDPGSSATWYKVDGDTVFYKSTTEKDIYDLDEKVTVVRILIDGRTVKAVEVNYK